MPEKFGRREYWERSAESNRSYEAYERFLGVTTQELEGKTILDLGSGEHEEFKKGVEERGIDATVMSLNPKLGLDAPEGEAAREKSSADKVVAGIAQQLPFRDESFDSIVSLDAIPLYLKFEDEEYHAAFSEVDRVLKKGGIAKFYPIRKFEKESENKKQTPLEKALSGLEKKGYEVAWEKIEVSDEEIEQYHTLGGYQLTLKKPKKDA